MNKSIKIISIICFTIFLLVSFGLPFFSFEGYSIISNTTSHLAAQGSPYALLMDIVFVSLGLLAIIITYNTKVIYHQVIGGLFGLSLIMTAFFPHGPLVANTQVNVLQDQLHSIFASTTGFSFTLLAIGHTIMSKGKQRYWGIIIATIAILISLAMMLFPSLMGILQRIMLISAFSWLFFYMKVPNNTKLEEV